VCYDDNLITIDGNTDLSFTEDVNARYVSYGWHVQTVDDANDIPTLRYDKSARMWQQHIFNRLERIVSKRAAHLAAETELKLKLKLYWK
jgi:transketolase